MSIEIQKNADSIEPTQKNHTFFAKLWIGLMTISSLFSILLYLLNGDQIAGIAHIPNTMISIYILIGFGMIFLLIFLYHWKRWAFFGLCGLSFFTMILNIYLGTGGIAIFGLLGVAILYLSIKSEWKQYD
jgi:hypothetical protein